MSKFKIELEREFLLPVFITEKAKSGKTPTDVQDPGLSLVIMGVGAFPITQEHLNTLGKNVGSSSSELTTDLVINGLLHIMLRKDE
jgi:hypothetical protein